MDLKAKVRDRRRAKAKAKAKPKPEKRRQKDTAGKPKKAAKRRREDALGKPKKTGDDEAEAPRAGRVVARPAWDACAWAPVAVPDEFWTGIDDAACLSLEELPGSSYTCLLYTSPSPRDS